MTTRQLAQIRQLRKEVEQDKILAINLQKQFKDTDGINDLMQLMAAKQEHLISEYIEAEKFISSVNDSLVRQILTIRYIEGLSWSRTALKIGGGNTPDSIRKMVYRYMERNNHDE